MVYLDHCPACAGSRLQDLYAYNDLATMHANVTFDPAWAKSDFALCWQCGLLFARQRQPLSMAVDYYDRFAELENRRYAVYPPPSGYIEGKTNVATEIMQYVTEQGLVRPTSRVLHLRCDVGTLLARMRDEHGLKDLFGLDYFPSNVRYAREVLHLQHVHQLSPGELRLPFDEKSFDLIVSNHQVTHAFEPLTFIQGLHSLLSPGGSILMYNEEDHLRFFTEMDRVGAGINNFHKQLLTEASLANLCRLGGLDVRILGRRRYTMLAVAVRGRVASPVELPEADYQATVSAFRGWIMRHEASRRRLRFKRLLARLPGAAHAKMAWQAMSRG